MFTLKRHPENPLFGPRREYPWEALATYNPSVVEGDRGLLMYYRALAEPAALIAPYAAQSSIGLAESEDGVHFHSRRPAIVPSEPWDAFGCEDPRATYFEGTWYVFYTALGGVPFGPDNIKVGVAMGTAPDQLIEKHLVTPFNAKAATLFPERIGGDIVLLLTAHTGWTEQHPRPTIAVARARDMQEFFDPGYWERWHGELEKHALPTLRRADDDHVETGASPLRTPEGWLLIYSYIRHYYDERERVFGVEAALLDPSDPQKLLARTYPFMVPEEIYEQYGLVPDIVFPTSALPKEDGTPDLYYGAADTMVAKATVKLPDLLSTLDSDCAPVFVRAKENPILQPSGNPFEAFATFNPAALDLGGKVRILYRAMGQERTSTVGYAVSEDGIHIDSRLPVPIYGPRADFEVKRRPGNSGCEDPRTVVIDDRIYMTYTAYDGIAPPRGALASIAVEDFLAEHFDRWSEPVLITPTDVDDKDVALLPGTIDGNYLLYHRVGGRICADILPDLSFKRPVSRCIEIMGPREGMWDAAKVGVAGPPIAVPGGYLMIYHGVSRRNRYRLGAALLDPSGTTLLSRTADPIFEPDLPYELEGEVDHVVFSCGAIVRGGTLFLYYGGGDRVVGVATGSLPRIVAALS